MPGHGPVKLETDESFHCLANDELAHLGIGDIAGETGRPAMFSHLASCFFGGLLAEPPAAPGEPDVGALGT
jgi:hypothetical protein